jgi:hypothetical protein
MSKAGRSTFIGRPGRHLRIGTGVAARRRAQECGIAPANRRSAALVKAFEVW